jgi:DNA-binding NarL/FixJ family response regulator
MTDTDHNANLIVLSSDATLIDVLRTGIENRHRIWRADGAKRAAELVNAARLGVVLVDCALAGDGTAQLVEQIAAALPRVPLLVAGRRDDEAALADHISSGDVFRFLHKPVSPERARTFIDAAVRRRLELAPESAETPEMKMPGEPEPLPAPVPRAGSAAARLAVQKPRRLWWPKRASDQDKLRRSLVPGLGFAVAGAIVLAAMVLQPWQRTGMFADPDLVAPARPPAQSPRDIGIARLLDAAGIALTQGRITSPPERNALALYRSVLEMDGVNLRAQTGLHKVADALATKAEQMLAARNLEEAEAAVALARDIYPQHQRLDFLETQLEAERERRRLEAAEAAYLAADPPAEPAPLAPLDQVRESAVTENLSRAVELQRLGRLAGGSHSSLSYLQSAMDIAPRDPRVVAAAGALSTTLLQKAQQALDRGDYAGAKLQLDYADELGVDLDSVRRLRNQFDTQRTTTINAEQARLLDLANRRLLQGRLLDPPADSAAYYVDLLRAANPDFRGLADTTAVLASRLLQESRRLRAAGRTAEAQRVLDAAVAYGADPNAP